MTDSRGFVVFHRACGHVMDVASTRVLAARIASRDHAWRVRAKATEGDVAAVLARVRCEVCQPGISTGVSEEGEIGDANVPPN